ncbi:hypothetical protein AAFF_G00182940 [Aldrovandia affinis]|uniref:Secreted protein n=1 Tax=Aldrovandia affinis TaxID=143900 RepID=A0AAD7W7H7_9TELE|nr:hypothetical protein AAFF_G00182940 [Aldrovandia affinis]
MLRWMAFDWKSSWAFALLSRLRMLLHNASERPRFISCRSRTLAAVHSLLGEDSRAGSPGTAVPLHG